MRKKRLLCLFLVLALFLSGCNLIFPHFLDAFYGYSGTIDFDEMTYTRPDQMELQKALHRARSLSQSADSIQSLISAIDDFNDCYDRFFTNYALANIHYNLDLTDTYWRDEYNFCSETEPAVYAALEELYQELARSPFRQELERDDYFGADFFVPYESEGVYDSVFLALLEEEAALVNQYYELTNEASELEVYSEEYFSRYATPMAELLAQLVAVRQKIAAHAGCSDYVEYAYLYSFARDYSPEEVEKYAQQISRTFHDLYVQTSSSDIWQKALSYCTEEETFRYMAQAADAMGGGVKEAFDALSDSSLYDLSYSENKYPASFEVYLWSYYSPFVFLYPYMDQGDKLTFAHEFGHFVNDYFCYGSYAATDIAEIYSQAMEYLTLCYSKDNRMLTRLKMADSLSVYVECTAYTLFEHRLYGLSGSDLTAENILQLYQQIGTQFGFDSNYWDPREFITIPHFYTDPLYNISYVVSNDLALQFYQLEQAETGAGLQLFEECITDESSYLLDFAERYGLESPFTEERLEKVADIFQRILFES